MNALKYRVKQICRKKGITIQDIAAHLGMSQPAISLALSRNPTLTTLNKIAEALGVETSELIPPLAGENAAEKTERIHGYLKVNGELFEIGSWADIDRLRPLAPTGDTLNG